MQLGRGGQGGQAEARFGGVLEVGAGVGEEDEGHGCGDGLEMFGLDWRVRRGLVRRGMAQGVR